MTWFSALAPIEQVFLGSAIIGGIVLAVYFLLQFLGADTDVDTDADSGFDATFDTDLDPDLSSNADADADFRALSLQGLSAFATMFGLVGFAVERATPLPTLVAIAAGCAAGAMTMWTISKVFRVMLGLQSSGNIDVHAALGQEAEVYLAIPRGGTGKVQLTVADRFRVFDAMSESSKTLPTGSRVFVTNVAEHDVLVVDPVPGAVEHEEA